MDELEVTVKYNLTWDKPYSYEPVSRSVLVNGDSVFYSDDWILARTVTGLLNSAFNMGKMAGLLEAQNFKGFKQDLTKILNDLED